MGWNPFLDAADVRPDGPVKNNGQPGTRGNGHLMPAVSIPGPLRRRPGELWTGSLREAIGSIERNAYQKSERKELHGRCPQGKRFRSPATNGAKVPPTDEFRPNLCQVELAPWFSTAQNVKMTWCRNGSST